MTQGTDHTRLRLTAASPGDRRARARRGDALTGSAWLILVTLVGGCLSAGSIGIEGATSTTTTGEGNGTPAMSSTSATSGPTGSTSDASSMDASSSSDSTSTSTSDTTTAGCSFLCPQTGGDEPCSLFDDQCPRGEKCSFYQPKEGGYANDCFPLDRRPAAPGEPCVVHEFDDAWIDSCDRGSICWYNFCLGFCDGDEDNPSCSEPGTWCYQRSGINGLCLPECYPLFTDSCGSEGTCVPVPGDGYRCLPDVSGDAGAYGDPCEAHNECDPGLFCLPQELVPKCGSASCCTPVCDLDGPESCPLYPLHACVPWYDDPKDIPPGLGNVGVCAVPP